MVVALVLCFIAIAYAEAGNGTRSISTENRKQGTKAWWYKQSNVLPSIQGFSTAFSYLPGDKVQLKVSSPAHLVSYSIGIYRLGYYKGFGGRLLANLTVAAIAQPACVFETQTRLTDCANWRVTSEWRIPGDAASGVYIALPVSHTESFSLVNGSYIPFVVRQPLNKLGSDILFKTADLTWVAYNKFGNWNLYRGNGSFHQSSRAYQASYNRPWQNRLLPPEGHFINFIFGAEFPMLFWLEKHGYDVAYCSCADIENMYNSGHLVPTDGSPPPYKSIISVGHDEYWTPGMKEAHERARERGVHLAFFSGNEVFWRVKWLESTSPSTTTATSPATTSRQLRGAGTKGALSRSGKPARVEGSPELPKNAMPDENPRYPANGTGAITAGPQRIIVCRKETLDNIPTIPADDWTGTFRDPRYRSPEDESLLTGQKFMVNAHRKDAMTITREDALMRFWRNASFTSGGDVESGYKALQNANCTAAYYKRIAATKDSSVVHTSAEGVLGYEWDVFPMQARPAGLFPLSTTSKFVDRHILQDYGASYSGAGVAVHRLSMYRHVTYHEDDTSQQKQPAPLQEMCRKPPTARGVRSSALVFGAGTVQWSFALNSWHDGYSIPLDRDLAQATINLLGDMGVFPSKLQRSSGRNTCALPLMEAAPSPDKRPPTSRIMSVELRSQRMRPGVAALNSNANSSDASASPAQVLSIRGEASDVGGGQVAAVEVSVDAGATWHMASGRRRWSFTHHFTPRPAARRTPQPESVGDTTTLRKHRETLFQEGFMYFSGAAQTNITVLVLSRAVDDSGWIEEPAILQGLCAVKNFPARMPSFLQSRGPSKIFAVGAIRNVTAVYKNVVLVEL
jgi:hypothetical protein